MNQKDFDYNTKFSFIVHWHDHESALVKRLQLSFFPNDNTVELFDIDSNRVFLRRSACDNVKHSSLFLGNKIKVFGRQLEIKDYADCATEKLIGKSKQHTFAIIKPSAISKIGKIISEIQDRQFQVYRMQMSHLTRREALDFYESRKGDTSLPSEIENIISGPVIALELIGENAVQRFKAELGNMDPEIARKELPDSLRANYGKNITDNGIRAADSLEMAIKEADYFFPQGSRKPPRPSANFVNCTCCVIKPHAIAEGKLGRILSSISDNELFKFSGLRMIYFSDHDAEEFLEIYRGVVSDFNGMLSSFLDGPCVVLEIGGKKNDVDVYQEFRKFVGPSDPHIAREIRSNTLRGLYGVDKYRNAVHCTDLREDTTLELECFFNA